ncbi:MAG: zinc-ribbon domain-containing protein, partial [Woeseiaceae bacterium]|nr:zinc-ribbon domain-containing protein [Woeseiaceae bacterium]
MPDGTEDGKLMYTQCPACEVAFRVTADVLQQARGRVRCGNCREAFNALDHLSESAPVRRASGPVSPDPQAADKDRELMDTLSQLVGPEEVRIEDTGIEWRVVDEDDEAPDDSSGEEDDGEETEPDDDDAEGSNDEPAAAEPAQAGGDEPRYDDNTPLPEDLFDDDVEPPAWETPRRRAEDFAPVVEVDESQAELELGDADDWADLLGEVDDEPVAGDAVESDGHDAAPDGPEPAEEHGSETGDDEAIPQLAREQEAPSADADSGFYSNRFTVVQDADGDLAITEGDDDEADIAEVSAEEEVAGRAAAEASAGHRDPADGDSEQDAPASRFRLIDESASADESDVTDVDGGTDEALFSSSHDADHDEADDDESEIEIDDDPSGEYESALALAAIDDEVDGVDDDDEADEEGDEEAQHAGEEPPEPE